VEEVREEGEESVRHLTEGASPAVRKKHNEEHEDDRDLQGRNCFQNLSVIISKPRVMLNIFIFCCTSTAGSYSFYFIEFYLKLLPSNNVYILMSILGLADTMNFPVWYFMVSRLSYKKIYGIIFGSLIASSFLLFTLVAYNDDRDIKAGDEMPTARRATYTILIFTMRLMAQLSFSIHIFMMMRTIPTLLQGAAYQCTNVFVRTGNIFAPLIAELLPNPSITVTISCTIALIAAQFINEHTKTD